MLVRDLAADFLARHRPATARVYRQGLAWLLAAFAGEEWDRLERIPVKRALEASYVRPGGEKMSDATERRNKVAFKLLAAHVVDELEISEARVLKPKDLKAPSSGRRERLPTPAELDRLAAAATPAFALALRGLRASGMRPGELCAAEIAAIEETAAGRVLVFRDHKTARKTGKARRVAIAGELADVVAAAAAGRAAGPVWLDDRGGRWTPRRLARRFRTLRRRLGLSEELVPYSHRHYVATAVARGAGLLAAQQLLGHASLRTTQGYLHGGEVDQRAGLAALGRAEAEGRTEYDGMEDRPAA